MASPLVKRWWWECIFKGCLIKFYAYSLNLWNLAKSMSSKIPVANDARVIVCSTSNFEWYTICLRSFGFKLYLTAVGSALWLKLLATVAPAAAPPPARRDTQTDRQTAARKDLMTASPPALPTAECKPQQA